MIGPTTVIRGNINADEDLTIEGNVEGSIRVTKDVSVKSSSTIEATIEADNLDISGTVRGDVTTQTSVSVASGATLVGNVTTPHLHVADGSFIQGRVEMQFDVPAFD